MSRTLEKRSQNKYRGRFAPSPSGYLHYGSLITALASYLDAKFHHGDWLVRIEDIDPPREKAGASQIILDTLIAFGLQWDEDVLYQSQQTNHYLALINRLLSDDDAYYCQCTRAQIKAIGGIYLGHCRPLKLTAENNAVRVFNKYQVNSFEDIFQGNVTIDKQHAAEDFIILRRDGLFAYQLAVVADDISQNISHVIRGCDLLEPTMRQLSFIQQLNANVPVYGHIPLAVTDQGYKLSKQNKAPAIDPKNPQPVLFSALKFLGQQPPKLLKTASVSQIITWGVENWCRENVPKQTQITIG